VWPQSLAEQTVFIDQMQKRLDEVQAARNPIIVHSFSEPTQDDWEAAWIQKSGALPPIPVGTKLTWYDLKSGRMRLYTTTYDLQNGSDSSGNVVVWERRNKVQDNFRFLGALNDRGTLISAYTRSDNTVASLLLNEALWRQRGLRKLYIYLSIVVSATPTGGFNDLALYYSEYSSKLRRPYQESGLPAGSEGTAVYGSRNPNTASSPAFDVVSGNYLTLQLTSVISDSPTPFVGVLELDKPNSIVNDEDIPQIFTEVGSLWGASFGTNDPPIVSGITIHFAAFARNGVTTKQRHAIFYTEPTGFGNIDKVISDSDNQAWVYGLFDQPSTTEMGEY
jgi:hypothetical protein